MITSWISSREVVSRVLRNIKGVEADYVDSIPEWIGEGVRKLKTKYSLKIRAIDVQLYFHVAKFKIPSESIMYVTCKRGKLRYWEGAELAGGIDHRHRGSWLENVFVSGVPIYSTTGDPIQSLDDYTGGNPFPRDIIEPLSTMGWAEGEWWKMNGPDLQSSLKDEKLTIWYMSIPTDEQNFPIIPDNEYYMECLYWYNRMKLIEAGFEDKVFNHGMAQAEWEKWWARAIADVTYPTVSQMEEQIQRHLNLFPHEYHWGAHADWGWGGAFYDL
jgi:hypothetical protein